MQPKMLALTVDEMQDLVSALETRIYAVSKDLAEHDQSIKDIVLPAVERMTKTKLYIEFKLKEAQNATKRI